jgi:phosphopantothenoylcysteine decarboxylase/phosphopantothenate--cysteine ligase
VRLKKKLNILVSAGPTREPIDPVRFISNYSTGLLGWEIARQAKGRGHRVILISGPTALAKAKNIRLIDIQTPRQLEKELRKRFSWCDCLIMTAAVCDFRPHSVAGKKIKREKNSNLSLKLKQNPDILKGLGRRKGKKMLIGFSLDTEDLQKNAQRKLRQKNLDLIVATSRDSNSFPFGKVKLDALIIDKTGQEERLRQVTKKNLAQILLKKIEKERAA